MQTTSWFLVYLLGFAESAIAESDHRGSSAHLGSRCGFKRSSSGIGPWGSGAESEGPLVCEDRSRSALADCGCIGPDQPLPVIPPRPESGRIAAQSHYTGHFAGSCFVSEAADSDRRQQKSSSRSDPPLPCGFRPIFDTRTALQAIVFVWI